MRHKEVKDERGFTILELITVITVMGIIMAILTPAFIGVTNNVKANSDIRSVQMLQRQAEIYKAQIGEYPGLESNTFYENKFAKELYQAGFIELKALVKEDNNTHPSAAEINSLTNLKIKLQSGATLAWDKDKDMLKLDGTNNEILKILAKNKENQEWIK